MYGTGGFDILPRLKSGEDVKKHGNRRPFMLLLRSQTFCSSSRFTFARVSVIHSANQ